jgi:hypothetical protein
MSRWLSCLMLLAAGPVMGQGRNDETYLPGRFNWRFLRLYPEAARLFNAFDYGHAILYQRLTRAPDAPVDQLESREFEYLVGDLLRRPPRFAIAEEAVMPSYGRMAWRAKVMFERAHVLHRQIYDAHADDRLTEEERHQLVERLTDYYLSDRRYAFTERPKAMELMDEQSFSQVFRRRYPKFNGLIWAYHWLQVGLYEPLIEEPDSASRRRGVATTIARFWAMTESPPAQFPSVMPMTSAVAPQFSAQHPRAAVIFDNLHMMHDIISDILVSPEILRGEKARAIDRALDEFQDGTKNVVEMEHWRMMADHMGGVAKMGGVAGRKGGLPPAPTSYLIPGVSSGLTPSRIGSTAVRQPLPNVTVRR